MTDWSSVSKQDLVKFGGGRLLNYYSSLREALEAVYPESLSKIGSQGNDAQIKQRRVRTRPIYQWTDTKARRSFLDNLAYELGVKQVIPRSNHSFVLNDLLSGLIGIR